MNKLQISQKLKNIIGRLEYVNTPPGFLQGELIMIKADLQTLEREMFKEHMKETNPIKNKPAHKFH